MPDKSMWLVYVALAGLAWGTYVPFISLAATSWAAPPPPPLGARLMAILCVGVAYFILAILIPLVMFGTGRHPGRK